MDFAQFLNQEAQKMKDASSNSDRIEPKHGYPITIPSNTRKYFRLLPSVVPNDPMKFVIEFRQIFIPFTKKDGSRSSIPIVLAPLPKDKNHHNTRELTDFEKDIERWRLEGKLPGKFGPQRPRKLFYMNVVQINEQGQMEIGNDGQPLIRVLQMTSTAYAGLLSILSDKMGNPIPESEDYPTSFISDKETIVISIKAPMKGTTDAYQVGLTPVHVPPMPAGWNALDNEGHPVNAEDLVLLTTPTEISQPDTVDFLRQNLDGVSSGYATPQTNPYGSGIAPLDFTGQMPWDDPNAASNAPVQQAPFANVNTQQPPVQKQTRTSPSATGNIQPQAMQTAPGQSVFNTQSQPEQLTQAPQAQSYPQPQAYAQPQEYAPQPMSQQAAPTQAPMQAPAQTPPATFVPTAGQQQAADKATQEGQKSADDMMASMKDQLHNILGQN